MDKQCSQQTESAGPQGGVLAAGGGRLHGHRLPAGPWRVLVLSLLPASGGWFRWLGRNGLNCARQLLLGLILLAPAGLMAAELPEPGPYPLPDDLSQLHFYLITVAPGRDNVWENFGHTALRMYDESNGTDAVYNWGLFDLSGGLPGFAWQFFRAPASYRLGLHAPGREFNLYRSQQRTVWQDRINLTAAQKARLYQRLLWNAEPANRAYPYQYFTDNCTTRVRDYLNEALGGGLKARHNGMTDTSYRHEIRHYYAPNPLVRLSLDILMNSNVERPMSEWEAMFLPLTLRQQLLATRRM